MCVAVQQLNACDEPFQGCTSVLCCRSTLHQSIVAKMVMTSDGSEAWGMSESGLLHLPLGKLYDYPILQTESP